MDSGMEKQPSVNVHLIGILKSIDEDLILALKTHEIENRGGFMSISRSVFCYVDYLGALAFDGENSTKNAIKYMEEYFTEANSNYKGKCNAIYYMWRHGTVHAYKAQVYKSNIKQFKLIWGANNTSRKDNRELHLKCFCIEDKPNSYGWNINLFELVEDLKSSVIYLIRDIEFDRSSLQRVKKNLQKLSSDVDLDTPSKRNPDDAGLLSEAENIVGHAVGIINRSKQVVLKTPKEIEEFKQQWNQ